MSEAFIILILLAVCCILSGPVAIVISIIALSRTKDLLWQIQNFWRLQSKIPPAEPKVTAPESHKEDKFKELAKPEKPASRPPVPIKQPVYIEREKPPVKTAPIFEKRKEPSGVDEVRTLEQLIGTRWVLIAGIITVIVGVGFFLKYAYDNSLVGPLGRVIITTISGLAALAVGEITRKRGYGIVAKATTALGFAILYAAVFSAYRFYQLIGSGPTFILAILVTLAAMLYAVSLDEILIAVISLIGGFLTPVLVSTGENLPVPLFSYVLILGIGAMLCAWYRRWRLVNMIAFVGTFVLYTGWFEKFFRQQLKITSQTPEQMATALGWLGTFFVIYMTLPLFNGLVKKLKAQKEDVLLVLTNAAVTFYYLWMILYTNYRIELAFCAVGLCIAHLAMMSVVIRRCEGDSNLRIVLLSIGLFFLTIAIPLFLDMYAVAFAWAAEAVILTIIGLRYRSVWVQICAAIAFLLSFAQLVNQLPMHTAAFTLILNPAFGTWLFVYIALAVCYALYRKNEWLEEYHRDLISQITYSAACLLLMLTLLMEWFWHCDYNVVAKDAGDTLFTNGAMLVLAVFTVLLVVRPICPVGRICKIIASFIAFVGSIFTIYGLAESYHDSFIIFANVNFAFAILFVAGLFTAAWFLKRSAEQDQEDDDFTFFYVYAIAGIFLLWILLSEQIYLYWYCKNRYAEKIVNWEFLSNMYMSIMWAAYGILLMITGFWRKIALLRYISLGLFGLLLAKIFILDMGTVKSVYRIAAFLATGVTLVGVSYLYQHLRKKGFFDAIIVEEKIKDRL
jgi:uncharacterized membrane protein